MKHLTKYLIFGVLILVPLICSADINEELIDASAKGITSKVKDLIEQGADLDARNKDGYTALMTASLNGHTDTVKALIEAGADITAKSKGGWTSIMFAASAGHTETVKALLDAGAAIDARDGDDKTPLMLSSFNGHTEAVRCLIERGAAVNAKTKDGWTSIIFAAGEGHTDTIKILLDAGADVNAKTKKNGITPILSAVQYGQTEVVRLLIERGADVNGVDNTNKSALMVAAFWCKKETLKLLIEKGADIKARDMAGNTALMYLILGFDFLMKRLSENKQMDFVKNLKTIAVEIANILLTAGADVTAKNKGGLTAYYYASANRHSELAQLLEKAGGGLVSSSIFSLKERLQFEGFSILPPQSNAWHSMDSDTKGIILGRYTGKEIHTVMASARIEEYKDLSIKSRAEFLQYAKEIIEEIYKDARFKPIDIKFSSECYRGGDCVRYDFTIEDHGAPHAPGSILILTGYGFLFIHPDSSKYIVDINYSQRFLKGDKLMPVEGEIESFFKSLEFTPIK